MKKLIFILILFVPVLVLAGQNNCLTCHQDFEDDDGPSHIFSRDVHSQKGIGCVDCHGGDASLEDMDEVREVRGYRGVPSHREVPDFCARCHSDATYMRNHNPALATDQLDKYKTSVHGERLYRNNDKKVANCISCHSVHEMGNGKMPHSSTHPFNIPYTCGKCHSNPEYMAEYGIATDQLHNFEQSVHGKALLEKRDAGAPACNDCHSNHGAAPPGTENLAAVCGTCHALEAELFVKSPHNDAFNEKNFPMCETCHSNHLVVKPSDAMIGDKPPSVCIRCHSDNDGTKGLETAKAFRGMIDMVVAGREEAHIALREAITKGMMTTDEELRLKEVDQALIQTRTQVHSFNMEDMSPHAVLGKALTDTVKANSAGLIDEYYFRRKGLGLASLFITLMAIGLYIKIRRLP